ncbi:hypothetical protein CVT25_011950 [Psilocybe cyanescens]|uniref:F-box domain-containing protein n=1 Tax=Psilocybe cyanescens TaxID=93625 RepID=A0A409XQH8_PSICY|nr:hypothetical protein CVT25_011950 [Psilocybe cyanescens]
MLVLQFNRWKDVRIKLPPFVAPWAKLLPSKYSVARRLTHFHVETSDISPKLGVFIQTVVSQSPVLKSLTLITSGFSILYVEDKVRWAQLTDLHLQCSLPSDDLYFDILSRTPLLESCHLECSKQLGPSLSSIKPLPPSPITFLHLRVLELCIFSSVFQIFKCLTLPKLESLTIAITDVRPSPLTGSESTIIPDLIRRSKFCLLALKLKHLRLCEDALIESLILLPKLQAVTILDENALFDRVWQLTDKVVDLLGQPYRDTGVFACPELTVIRFSGLLDTSDGQKFMTMVQKRSKEQAIANKVAGLKFVDVGLHRL